MAVHSWSGQSGTSLGEMPALTRVRPESAPGGDLPLYGKESYSGDACAVND
jgi:hypothetical protein